jgi:hypothetical protein
MLYLDVFLSWSKILITMKKTVIILISVAAIFASSCSNGKKEYVVLGQLNGTFGHGTQEKMKGRVKEIKQTHFWAEEKDGKVVKGRVITTEDRKATPLGRDYTEQYNTLGIVTRSTTYDENGKVLLDIKAISDVRTLKESDYYINDTLKNKVTYRYEGEKIVEASLKNPVNDTLLSAIKYEYDQKGQIIKIQNYNFRMEPQGYSLYVRDENGSPLKADAYNKAGKMTSLHAYTYDKKGDRNGHHEENFMNGEITNYTFMYEYDQMGNYTAIIFVKEGKPFIYRAREITYY